MGYGMHFHNVLLSLQPSRGIRQGGHLSPYIFILCIEILDSELVKKSKNPKNHIAIPTHRNEPKIYFLMFADECIIFAKTSQNACSNFNRILHNFCAMFSQPMNFHKSSGQIFNNTQGATKRILGEALNIPFSNGINKYIGCPLI